LIEGIKAPFYAGLRITADFESPMSHEKMVEILIISVFPLFLCVKV